MRKKLLAIAASVLISLVLAEGGLRVYFWHHGIGRGDLRQILERSRTAKLPEFFGGSGLYGLIEPSPYPDVTYQLKPHLNGTHRGAPVATNRFGMRGPEITENKPSRTYRIVGLGDSHMFGWGVGQQEYYLTRLEQKLNAHAEPGWHFEVLNFGTPGYNTCMEVATFEHRGLRFAPDFVLLHFIGNDLRPPHFTQPPPSLRPSRWYLVELTRGLFSTKEEANGIEGDDQTGDEGDTDQSHDDREAYQHLGGRKAFRNALSRLATLTRERKIPVLMFGLGEKSELRKWVLEQGRRVGFPFENAIPYFTALLRENGLSDSAADFRKIFRGMENHPSSIGHEAYARALFCELEDRRLPHLFPADDLCPPIGTPVDLAFDPPYR